MYNTVSQKIANFGKPRLILIILGKQHQHTFKRYTHIQLSSSLHFYLLYLLFDNCGGNNAKRMKNRKFDHYIAISLQTLAIA